MCLPGFCCADAAPITAQKSATSANDWVIVALLLLLLLPGLIGDMSQGSQSHENLISGPDFQDTTQTNILAPFFNTSLHKLLLQLQQRRQQQQQQPGGLSISSPFWLVSFFFFTIQQLTFTHTHSQQHQQQGLFSFLLLCVAKNRHSSSQERT